MLNQSVSICIQDVSNIYETEPVGYTDQDDFLNGAVKISTRLTPVELLCVVQDIEKKLGRTRLVLWGPRTIDLDILLYNDQIIREKDLIIPHPELQNRRFVLLPLADIAQDVIVPSTGKTIQKLLAETSDHSRIHLYQTSADVKQKLAEG